MSVLQATFKAHCSSACLISAGLPANSVIRFLADLTSGKSLGNVPGVTASVMAAGISAYQSANLGASRKIFLTSIAFTRISVVTTFLLSNVDASMTDEVLTKVHRKKDERFLSDGTKTPGEAKARGCT